MSRALVKRLHLPPAIRTGNSELDRALDALRGFASELADRPIARLTLRVRLAPGLNKLDHGLGEAPLTFSWTVDAVGETVADAQSENPFPGRQLWVRLSGAAAASATLLVY